MHPCANTLKLHLKDVFTDKTVINVYCSRMFVFVLSTGFEPRAFVLSFPDRFKISYFETRYHLLAKFLRLAGICDSPALAFQNARFKDKYYLAWLRNFLIIVLLRYTVVGTCKSYAVYLKYRI